MARAASLVPPLRLPPPPTPNADSQPQAAAAAAAGEEEAEEEEEVERRLLIPRSSPVPRPRDTPVTSDDEAEAAAAAAAPARPHSRHPLRRVLFADEALGLPLAQLRRYRPWGDPPEDESPPELALGPPSGPQVPPFYLLPGFVLPPAPGRLERLRRAMVELEDLLPPEDPGDHRGPVLRGLIRVLNLSYHKSVHVRATHDRWATYHDHPAHYVPGGSPDGGQTDRFAFQLAFDAPGREGGEGPAPRDGARVDFVVRYQTPDAVYWANNQGKNYTVVLKETAAARGTSGGAPPAPPPKPLTREVETRRLKSCMKPVRNRQNEEGLRRVNLEEAISVADWTSEKEVLSKITAPTALKPGLQKIQVPEVTVTSTSPEKKEFSRDKPVIFTESPQAPAIKIHPNVLSFLGDQEGLLASQGVQVSEGSQDLKKEVEPQAGCGKRQAEEMAVLGSVNGQRSLLGWNRRELSAEGPFKEQPSDSQTWRCKDLARSEESQNEDAVDKELEQLYLSHLSRLRAAELQEAGHAKWSDSGVEGAGDFGFQHSHPHGLLTDRDLILKWTGPERALNSSLAEEITLHYANVVQGVELIDDTKECDEEPDVSSSAEESPCNLEGDALQASPPEIVTLPFALEDATTALGETGPVGVKVTCDEVQGSEKESLRVVGKAVFFQDREEEKFPLPDDLQRQSPCMTEVRDSSATGLTATTDSYTTMPSFKPCDGSVLQSGNELTTLEMMGKEQGQISLPEANVLTSKEPAGFVEPSPGGQEEGSPLTNNPSLLVSAPKPELPENGLFEFSTKLQKALLQSLQFLGLLVFLPVVLNSCMSLVAIVLYLSLEWLL